MSALDAFRARVLDAPDDPDAWLVLGDALQAEGDPRGKLVALQAALEKSGGDRLASEVRRFLFDERDALVGPLARWDRPWFVDWRWGYPNALEMVVDSTTEGAARVIAGMDLFALRELRLVSTANFDAVIRAFLGRSWPLLWSLELGPTNPGAGRLDVPLSKILDAAPALLNLRVEFPDDIADLAHDSLDSLALSLRPGQIADLDLRRLPALHTLSLFCYQAFSEEELRRVVPQHLERLVLYLGVDAVSLDGVEVVPGVRPSADDDRLLTSPDQVYERRFHNDKGRFWAVRRRNNSLYVRYGRVDRPGRTKRIGFFTPYEASREHTKRVNAKLSHGYREVWPEGYP